MHYNSQKSLNRKDMGGSISVAMAGIFMAKMEKDVLKPPYQIFYRRYVDDLYLRKHYFVHIFLLSQGLRTMSWGPHPFFVLFFLKNY